MALAARRWLVQQHDVRRRPRATFLFARSKKDPRCHVGRRKNQPFVGNKGETPVSPKGLSGWRGSVKEGKAWVFSRPKGVQVVTSSSRRLLFVWLALNNRSKRGPRFRETATLAGHFGRTPGCLRQAPCKSCSLAALEKGLRASEI